MVSKYYISILTLNLMITTSLGKLNFQSYDESNADIMTYFFDKGFFDSSEFHLIIIPLNFPKVDPYSFTNLMVSLNHYSRNSLMVLDNLTVIHLIAGENFLLLQYGDDVEPLLSALESIPKYTPFSFSRVFVWIDGMESVKTMRKINMKLAAININEAFTFTPIVITDDVTGKKETTDGVKITIKNLLLSKKNSVINSRIAYNTNKTIITKSLKKAKQQLKLFSNQLMKEELQVIIFVRPMSVEKIFQEDNNTVYKGIDMSLLKAISKSLNVTYNLTEINITEYGSVHKNGTYTKAYTDILNHKSDLSINRFPMDESAPGIVAYPYDKDMYCFVVRTPKLRVRGWSMFKSFKPTVWYVMIGAYVGIYMFFLLIKEPHWLTITFIQSMLSSPQLRVTTRPSRRVFWGFWLLFVVMVTDTFISIYVIQLLPRKNKSTFQSIKQIIDLNFTLLTETGSFKILHPDLLNKTLIPYYGRPQDIEDKQALLTSKLTRIKLDLTFAGKFEVVTDCLRDRFVGPLISTSHVTYSKMGIIINRNLAAGQLIYWATNFVNTEIHSTKNASNCYKDRKFDAPIKLAEIDFIFKYCLYGLEASIIAFIGEILYFKIVPLVKRKVEKPRPEIIRVYPYNN